MKTVGLIFSSLILISGMSFAQNNIEPCPCLFQADPTLKTRCAYLIVPENRRNPEGKKIKLPFIIVESKNPNKKKDPVLFTAGGPGLSSLSKVKSINRRSLLNNRDYIAFEQRGAQFALPCLDCNDISEAVKKGYRNNLSIDSMNIVGVKNCRKKLLAQDIDLSAYNTDENVDDIEDLRIALNIDSLNLLGISYSGGLMMAVLQKYPKHIRSLILDSPLPEFINIDEQELSNFNEVLDQVLTKGETDSLQNPEFSNLKQRFHQYLFSIANKVFYIDYLEKGNSKSSKINYGRNEILAVLKNAMEDYSKINDVPFIVVQMMKGHSEPYIKELLDGVFGGNNSSGMRLSVYCSDKMAYSNKKIIDQQESIKPYLSGFHVNDVYLSMCDCWQVPPIAPSTKQPFNSNTPTLLGAGGMDDSCRPIYNDMIHHYFPNSQRLVFSDRQHAPLLNTREGDEFIGKFLDNPYRKIKSESKTIVALDN